MARTCTVQASSSLSRFDCPKDAKCAMKPRMAIAPAYPPMPLHHICALDRSQCAHDSVLKLMKSQRRTHQKTKHLDARYFYAKELEEKGEIEVISIPTDHMIADLLTKPIQGESFTYLSKCLTGNEN